MTTPLGTLPPPPLEPLVAAPPDLTPAPALLQALAHVGEVDLATGLGQRRLAEVIHQPAPGRISTSRATPRRRHWLLLAWALAAAVCLLLLALG